MIKEIKTIPLADFLSCLGHEPAMRKGTRLWYKSPLRQEQTPSFKVETSLNCWYDFGLGSSTKSLCSAKKGGNIIDLAAELYQSTDLRYLMRCIADSYPVPSVQTVASSFLCGAKRQGRLAPRHSAPCMERIEVVPLEHRALVAYLQERGIPTHIAKSEDVVKLTGIIQTLNGTVSLVMKSLAEMQKQFAAMPRPDVQSIVQETVCAMA